MTRTLALFFVTALVLSLGIGCTGNRLPSYVFFAALPRPEEWTQITPATRDRETLKFVLSNDATGALIAFSAYPSFPREPTAVAFEMKLRFAREGLWTMNISESLTPGTSASFRYVDLSEGRRGKVAVFRRQGIRDCIVAVGRWPAANDERAIADMDQILAYINIVPEE